MVDNKENNLMDKLISLCKRRGFIFPSSEIYGGLQGFWDFGPLGVELKNNIKKMWWKKFVQEREDMVGLDSAIITNPKVWEKSGHKIKFRDYVLECKKEKCHQRYKAEDILPEEIQNKLIQNVHKLELLLMEGKIEAREAMDKESEFAKSLVPEINKKVTCPNCQNHDWTEPRMVTGMFQTAIGAVESSSILAYLRPETAQGIFVNFENIVTSQRLKLPFGVAQIGKAFRNEITPGNFIFRSREFEQMEIEYFVKKGEDDKWFDYWVEESFKWFLDLGIKKENIKKRPQDKEELAHYAKATVDIEYNYPFFTGGEKGWAELVGISNRQDYDLNAHGLKYKDDISKEEFIPYVIEPSFGVDRAALTFLLDAYEEIKGGRTTTTESTKEEEVVLKLPKDLSPIKVAVLPLSKKENLTKVAKEIARTLKPHFMTAYDEVASIGRRYRRQDEIGTPYCVTVDFDSLEDKKVTIRDRDTMKQDRILIQEIKDYLKDKFNN